MSMGMNNGWIKEKRKGVKESKVVGFSFSR